MKNLPVLSLALCLALCLACGSAARADLTMTQEIQMETPQPVNTVMTVKIKGQKMRMEPNTQATIITDLKTGDTTTIMPAQKMVMTIPGAAVKELQKQVLAKAAPAASPATAASPQPTGNKQTINGYACEEYLLTSPDGSKVTTWVTQDIVIDEKTLAELKALSPDNDPFKGVLKSEDMKGFPVQTIIEQQPGAGKTTVTLKAISQNPIPDSDFEVPAGYREMKMPQLPGQ